MYGMHGVPLEARYLYRRGVELSEQEQHVAAVKCFRQAITISPRFMEAYLELYRSLVWLGRDEDARYCFKKLQQPISYGTCQTAQSYVKVD